MTFEEAVEELQFHCGSHPEFNDPRWTGGFLGMLRPYRGLKQETYVHLLQCIQVVENHVRTADRIDRRVMDALWGICYHARMWALDPGGMLQRNKLLEAEDLGRLRTWIEELEWKVTLWLGSGKEDEPVP